MLAKLGVETVLDVIQAWRKSGEPTAEQIRALRIEKLPEDYFTRQEGKP
jgi:hypothetical protein